MKKLLVILAILITCATTSVMGSQAPSKDTVENYLDEISYYQLNTITEPTYGSIGGEWTVFGLARYGTISDEFKAIYVSNLKKKADECKGVLSARKYTDYCRVIIALSAINENPENFYGYNFIKPLGKLENVIYQGLNGAVYTLLALDSKNYNIPKADSGHQTTREKIIDLLLDKELDGGGWNYGGTAIDVDMTAMIIQALSPYCDSNEDVKEAVSNGMAALSKLQNSDGTFSTAGVSNCESTAQVLAAMATFGTSIEDKKFIKNGNTVIDGLMVFYNNDGSFNHVKNGSANAMATDQAMYALTAYYRKICGKNSLYNMSDGLVKRTISQKVKNKFEKETTIKQEETTALNIKQNNSNIAESKKSTKSKKNNKKSKNDENRTETAGNESENIVNESTSDSDIEEEMQEITSSETASSSEELIEYGCEYSEELFVADIPQENETNEMIKEEKEENYVIVIIVMLVFTLFVAAVIIAAKYRKKHKK